MKIALLGYGKMGREVEAAAIAAGHTIAATFDVGREATVEALRSSGASVAIDFSQPGAVEANVRLCAKAALPIVIGTTAWEPAMPKVRRVVEEAGIGCVVGSNFSIGVNLFLQMVRDASARLNGAGYDAYILEAHHRGKKDYPSGTALRLSEAVVAGMKPKTKVAWELPRGEAISPDTLLISSIRAGTITGTHTVGFESEDDSIELIHRAKSRRGFATGAIRAAEWIVGRKGFHRFEENIEQILRRTKDKAV